MPAAWTVMVYMAGNNSLSDAAGVDLEEIRQIGSSDRVKACVFVKRDDGQGAERLVATKDGAGEQVDRLGEIDSGDPQSVLDFVRWSIAQAPADRYALVLWNHGGGFRPGDLDKLYQEVRGGDSSTRDARSELNRRADQPIARSLFSTTVREVFGLNSRVQREICSDDATGHSLDTIELGNICRAIETELGRPLDVLGMDACLMSNLEVAYQVRGSVGHIVGSEELEPGAGWPYQLLLRDLQADPDVDGAGFTKIVVQRYVESYKTEDGVWPITQCAIATDGIERISGALDDLSGSLRAELRENWPQLMTAQTNAVRFHFDLVDLATLCERLAESSLSAETRSAAAAVQHALEPDGYVIAEGHLGDQVDGCQGVSVYLPAPNMPMSPYYKDLAFAKKHHWDELVGDYASAVRGGP
jgi:cysteine peptidase C11 family protein